RDLTDLFVGTISQSPILLVVTCRPEFDPAWQHEPHATKMVLRPIKQDEAEYLIKCVPGAADLSADVVSGIAARADGIPLFIEELTKAVIESGPAGRAGTAGGPKGPVIPSSLHASLTARLDRLGKTREVARVAAALGREFTLDLLRASMPNYAADD